MKTNGFPITIATIALLAAASVAAAPHHHAGAHYPKDIQPLIDRELRLNELCRGTPGADADGPVCRRRDRLVHALEHRGWCLGSRNAAASDFELTWLRCSDDRTR